MDWPSDQNVGLVNGKFTDGDPLQSIPPSLDLAAHQNAITEEIINAITSLGGNPTEAQTDQLGSLIVSSIAQAIATTRPISEDISQRVAAMSQNVEHVNQLNFTPAYDGYLYLTAVMNIGNVAAHPGIDHRITVNVNNTGESDIRGDTTLLSQTHVKRVIVTANDPIVFKQKVTNFTATPLFVGMYLAYLYIPR